MMMMMMIIIIIMIMMMVLMINIDTERCNSRLFAISSVAGTCTLKWPLRDGMQTTYSTSGNITCNEWCATRQNGTAQPLSLTQLKSHLVSCISLAKTINDVGEEETGVPGENTRRQASENATH